MLRRWFGDEPRFCRRRDRSESMTGRQCKSLYGNRLRLRKTGGGSLWAGEAYVQEDQQFAKPDRFSHQRGRMREAGKIRTWRENGRCPAGGRGECSDAGSKASPRRAARSAWLSSRCPTSHQGPTAPAGPRPCRSGSPRSTNGIATGSEPFVPEPGSARCTRRPSRSARRPGHTSRSGPVKGARCGRAGG